MKKYGRVDSNQNEVVMRLRRTPGVTVGLTSAVGNGFPDFVCGFRGVSLLVELKSKGGKPTEMERDFAAKWTGAYLLAYSYREIMAALELLTT